MALIQRMQLPTEMPPAPSQEAQQIMDRCFQFKYLHGGTNRYHEWIFLEPGSNNIYFMRRTAKPLGKLLMCLRLRDGVSTMP